jgi:hypothetical protein
MKRLLKVNFTQILILSLFIGLFVSCQNDDEESGGEYYVRFIANGKKVEFSVQGATIAAFAQAGNTYNAVFTSYNTSSNIGLQVYDNKEITKGTYIGYTLSGTSFIGALIHYKDDSGILYTQDALNAVTSITISEITSSAVRGTFSGVLKSSGKPDLSITQGEFFVLRSN